MSEFSSLIPNFNFNNAMYNLLQMALAYGLSFPVAVNRERKGESAGFRTFPLVALASCAYMQIGTSSFDDQQAISRVLYGIIAGMGFIGGGAIIKDSEQVKGTATAAALWCSGAIGISVALNKYEISVLVSIATFFTFYLKQKNLIKK